MNLKCDEAKPQCSRCGRLDIVCSGSGQQRYLFKEQQGFQGNKATGQVTRLRASPTAETAVVDVPQTLNSNLTLLATSFIATIRETTSLKYSLLWSYGGFLEDIPCRLGTNEALDASVQSLVSAHSCMCLQQGTSIEALVHYSRALRKFRVHLDSPVNATTTETLCSVMLLMIVKVS